MKKQLEKYIKERKHTLADLVRKFDYEIDKHRLDEVEQLEKFTGDLITEKLGEERVPPIERCRNGCEDCAHLPERLPASEEMIGDEDELLEPEYESQPLTEGEGEDDTVPTENPEWPDNEPLDSQVDKLSSFLLKEYSHKIIGGGAIETAIQILTEFKPQQESNKEERKSEEFVEWQCSTCGRDWSVTTIKCPMCFKEEPSKKPKCIEMEIDEVHQWMILEKRWNSIKGDILTLICGDCGIEKSLTRGELHNQGKI